MKCPVCNTKMIDVETWEDASKRECHESISLFQCPKCKIVKTVRL